ncbi:MAG TPA: adenylate/guanylate cyclase domain-containing protein [Terrimicrobiaceae bacterium]
MMKPTLGQILALSLLGLALSLGLLFAIVLNQSRAAIIESSERIRDQASREITERVTSFLSKAPATVSAFQQQIRLGLVDPSDPQAVESTLFALLLAKNEVGEITLTYGKQTGFAHDGGIQLAPAPRWQLSVVRSTDDKGAEHFWSRQVRQENGAFVVYRRNLQPNPNFSSASSSFETTTAVSDPTSHLTFATPASRDFYGRLLWSDLHWSQIDANQPVEHQDIEVSVQRTVEDAAGGFAGVIRVGLLAEQLDRAVQLKLTPADESDPHRIFLADRDGRLITRGVVSDRAVAFGEDLRIAPGNLEAEIASALAEPKLRAVSETAPVVSGHFSHDGQEYLTTFRILPGTQDWIVGIVVPRAFYLGKLVAMRDRLLVVTLGVIVLLVAAGIVILRSVKRAQEQITRESLKMNAFEFSPAPANSAFRDVSQVLESLEKAKAAMRVMGKYAPVDLVRRLYREKSEPVLGGELMEISIMFSDIKGFTTFSEQLDPNQLADVLGLYLDALSRIIQQEARGTIDKYIGDAIMTIWNAPEPVPDHPHMACLAALRCRDASRALAQTPEWRGFPVFETRFGLHSAMALVGHFGARDRMNYTAIGDAINLASRLEALNKQYGTSIIASESIAQRANLAFDFRLLDVVAVKGKSDPITIYELLGAKGAKAQRQEMVDAYETAFAAYAARDFEAALNILREHESDPPSAVLVERCAAFLKAPPPPDWHGVYVAASK